MKMMKMKKIGLMLLACVAICTSCSLGGDDGVTFFEPYTAWETNVDATKKYMEGYSIYESSDDQILYNGKDMVYRYLYHFTEGRLDYSVLSVEKQHGQALVDYVESKYEYVGYTEDGSRVYANNARSTAITLYEGENLVLATYSPYPEEE